ncbi:MAG: extracellular solute-binding protein [Patescibacteria group bacterium]|nr:extracellular solute-binding protein [Patescibacteria group bacterium]
MFRYKIIIFLLIFAFILTTGQACKVSNEKKLQEATKPITLKYWRVFDGPDAFNEIITEYRALRPHINIEYRKLRFDEYEEEIIDALAEDRGPDIFSIHNTWMGKYKPKIASVPEKITMAYTTITGTFKKEKTTVLKTKPSISLKQLRENFVDVVLDDVIMSTTDNKGKTVDKIYGLPLSLDTLVLFYNRDLLNAAKIAQVPTTWKNFQQATTKMTKIDRSGNILQSGAALGASDNVERYFDILSLLMMQNGTKMTDERGSITFHQMPPELEGRPLPPGEEALTFYTDFASPSKEVYSWNDAMPNNLTAFTQGKIAFFFGYSYHLPTIRANAPKLNLGIAKAPQIEGAPEINYANYWVEVASKKSKHLDEAWDFIQFAADPTRVDKYLSIAKRPTALRALIESQLDDLDLGTFVAQTLTAETWYKGVDPDTAEDAFAQMIDSIISRTMETKDAIELAARRISQTLR